MIGLQLYWDRPNVLQNGIPPEIYLLIRLSGRSQTETPLHVRLAVDTSGSMKGPKLDQAKRVVSQILELMRPNDRVSVASFATDLSVIGEALQPGPGLEASRATIQGLTAGGGTRMDRALSWLGRSTSSAGQARVGILLTDGRPTDAQGKELTDTEELLKMARSQADSGMPLFAVGYGDANDFNSEFLRELAMGGHGAFEFAREPGDLASRLGALVQSAKQVALPQVELQLRPLITGMQMDALAQVAPAYIPFDSPQLEADGSLRLSVANVGAGGPSDVVAQYRPPTRRPFGSAPGPVDAMEVIATAEGLPPVRATIPILYVATGTEAQREDKDGARAREAYMMGWAELCAGRAMTDYHRAEYLTQVQQHAGAAGRPEVASAAAAELNGFRKSGVFDPNSRARTSSSVGRK